MQTIAVEIPHLFGVLSSVLRCSLVAAVILCIVMLLHLDTHDRVRVAAAHADKALFTQLSLDTREVFLHYQHNSDAVSDVTFNVKDFRHMLSMCESLGASVAIRFDQPGAPLLVEPQFRGTYVG